MADFIFYQVQIEWVTGSFTEMGSDVEALTIRQQLSGVFDSINAGVAVLTLDNLGGKWSPGNPSKTYIKTRKMLKVFARHSTIDVSTVSYNQYPLFNGYISDFKAVPNIPEKITVEAVDHLGIVKDKKIDTSMRVNVNVSSLFIDIFSHAGIPSSAYSIVTAPQEVIPYHWVKGKKVSEVLNDLLKLSWAQMHVNESGVLEVHNRYRKLGNSYGYTTASLVNDFFGFDYALTENDIINSVTVNGHPKYLAADVGTVAVLTEPVLLPASGAASFWLDYIDPSNPSLRTPAMSLTTPVASLDFAAFGNQDGSGSDYTSVVSANVTFFGASAVCSVFNGGGAACYLTRFQLRGYSIQGLSPIAVTYQDSSSVFEYGEHEMDLSSDYIPTQLYAKDMAQALVLLKKDIQPRIGMTLKNSFPTMFNIDLGEFIHVVESSTFVGSVYQVVSVDHTVTMDNGVEHVIDFGLSLPQIDGDYLVLDSSSAGTLDSRKLGF